MSVMQPRYASVEDEKRVPIRDYSLTGVNAQVSIDQGLAEADWYTTPISREGMNALLERSDGPGIRDTLIWFGLLFLSGWWGVHWWGSAWAVIPFAIYGVIYASSSDSRWHESSHGTVFKTDWMNNVLYEIASFMVFRESTPWKWSHVRHHSDTIIIGRDPEIVLPRPTNIVTVLFAFTGILSTLGTLKNMILHSTGRLTPAEKSYIPENEQKAVYWKAQIYLCTYATVIATSIFAGSWLPLMFIGLPTFYGSWLMPIYGITQHAGLAENVLDHRMNCRTVYMNVIHRYLYWNMGYHIEHHMFPLVPYHQLPKLHAHMLKDCPKPYANLWQAWKEIIPALFLQIDNPNYYVKRELPETAHPSDYRHQCETHSSVGEPDQEGWIQVDAAAPKVEDVIRFDHQGQTYAIYRTKCGNLHATDGICTHGSTHLADGLVKGDQVECPKHNGRFDVTDGSCQRNPVCIPVKTHPVKEENGKLFFQLNHAGGKGVEIDKPCHFRVVSNQNVAPFIKELVLEPLEGQLTFTPGDYLQLNIPPYQAINSSTFDLDDSHLEIWKDQNLMDKIVENRVSCRRNYSIASHPKSGTELIFNVRLATAPKGKSVQNGVGSSYVFHLKPGDRVSAIGPFGDFRIQDSEKEMIYIGGGAGMAPLKSHISHLFENIKTGRKVTYYYGARSMREVFYLDYFQELAKQHENFEFNLVLLEPLSTDGWEGPTGFVHESVEKMSLAEHAHPHEVEYYLCGPPMMVDATQAMLKRYDVKDESMFCDAF